MGEYKENPVRFLFKIQTSRGPVGAGMLVGMMLILAGTLLFIDNLGILPVDIGDVFWPLAIFLFSATTFYRTCSLVIKVWTVAGMLGAVLSMLGALHIIRVANDVVWPLILIAAGVSMLIGRWHWREFTDQLNIGTSSRTRTIENTLNEVAIFSGVKRRVEATNFEGGELASVFGSIDLDLRSASIATQGRVAAIEANAVFGGIEIRIPETWRLSLQGQAVFGSYEDKTIPPRPDPGFDPPTLVIRGGTAFGSVVVRN